jgi:hypothetical protein
MCGFLDSGARQTGTFGWFVLSADFLPRTKHLRCANIHERLDLGGRAQGRPERKHKAASDTTIPFSHLKRNCPNDREQLPTNRKVGSAAYTKAVVDRYMARCEFVDSSQRFVASEHINPLLGHTFDQLLSSALEN